MAVNKSSCRIFRLPLLLLFLLFPAPAESSVFGQWRTLFSLSHSLMSRVANLRASRGDFSGSQRARKIAEKLEGGFGFSRGIWSLGWDYFRNYAWRDLLSRPPPEVFQVMSEMNELLSALNQVAEAESEGERARWLLQNYQKVLRVSRSLLRRFLVIFSQSGSLRETILMLQEEVGGDLMQDCMAVGANDLKGLVQVAKEIILQYFPWSPDHRSDL